ncbi:MAG TPA: GNAT family N-acetyltransferase [Polyangiales bacterium]|nr:GNAT family N-acetyltransferase [Polyangiales bacterium]
MSLRELIITHDTPHWQDAFIEFVPQVFPEIGFKLWRDRGGWDERYTAFALADGDRIVASASRQQMDIVLLGRRMRAWQLSAVGTLPEYRRRGLQGRIMQQLLQHTPSDELMFLFANDTVLHFYPRFGFRQHTEWVFQAEYALAPDLAQPPLRTLDVSREDDRALLLRIAAAAAPVSESFAAADHGRIVLWYCSNFMPNVLRYVPEQDALLAVEQSGELLRVYDVMSPKLFELQTVLARLLDGPIERIELGFSPEKLLPAAKPSHEYTESPLFVRGDFALPAQPFKFPMLAQT